MPLVYLDMTLCPYDDCIKFVGCYRAFDDDRKERAKRWWKAMGGRPEEAPICLFAERPGCFKGVKEENDG